MPSHMVPTYPLFIHPYHIFQLCLEDSEPLSSKYIGLHGSEFSPLGHDDSTCVANKSCLPPLLSHLYSEEGSIKCTVCLVILTTYSFALLVPSVDRTGVLWVSFSSTWNVSPIFPGCVTTLKDPGNFKLWTLLIHLKLSGRNQRT